MIQQRTLPRTTPIPWTGYLAGAVAGALLLVGIHVWPGWQVVPFLTAETPAVLGAVDAMLVVGIAVNLLHLRRRPPWFPPAATVLTSAFGLAATAHVLDVFPFAFAAGSFWAPTLRVLLVVGIVGSAIGILVAIVQLIRLGRVNRA